MEKNLWSEFEVARTKLIPEYALIHFHGKYKGRKMEVVLKKIGHFPHHNPIYLKANITGGEELEVAVVETKMGFKYKRSTVSYFTGYSSISAAISRK
ncbi:MAG: hypothetical protein H7A06_00155 [Pseudomonadales bacterium]|nr:hypothetical protein [Pseudomonadales bacterium]